MTNNETTALLELLRLVEGGITVSFKKKNGEETQRVFTLHPESLPDDESETSPTREPQTIEYINEKDVMRAWSITDEGWRSFKPSMVTHVEVQDATLYEKKSTLNEKLEELTSA